jgi:small subunit ribosomal protein S2
LGGIREMKRLPNIILVIDTIREATAVKESNILEIPVMALADTNSDPDDIDYIIPANDDAVRAIKLIVSAFADAVLEGQAMRKPDDGEEPVDEAAPGYDSYEYEEEGDEQFLGASTLAKLRDSKLFGDEELDAIEEAVDE